MRLYWLEESDFRCRAVLIPFAFSGKEFCSTLEGQFVKALESYTRVTFSEEAVAKAGMFSSIEGGGDGIDYGRCSHGYTKGNSGILSVLKKRCMAVLNAED